MVPIAVLVQIQTLETKVAELDAKISAITELIAELKMQIKQDSPASPQVFYKKSPGRPRKELDG